METRQRDPSNSRRKESSSGKQYIAKPTNLGKSLVVVMMNICRKILLINTHWKIRFYLCGITIGSLVTDLFPMPRRAYFASKDNFLNTVFVKWGWAWTFSLLGIFIYVTATVYCCGKQKLVRQHLLRLLVGTVFWFVFTKSFEFVEHLTGFCDSGLAEHSAKRLCRKAGSNWIGFDISGHTFLLIHCLLTISEEVKCINGWERIVDVREELHPTTRMSNEELQYMKEKYSDNLPYVRGLVLAVTILQIIWEWMLLTTTLFFHNMPQKLLGATFAIFAWFLSYQLWFKMDTLPPGPTGKGLFKYMKNH